MSELADTLGQVADALGEPALQVDGLAQVERVRRGMWIHANTPRPPTANTPHSVIHTHDKLNVRFYAPAVDEDRPPVVLVPSLINRATILDLEPDRSVVRALSEMGHPVYLIDWGVPQAEDAHEDVAYVIHDLLHRSIDRICRHAGHSRALVLGYCLGGTLAAIHAALHPERVAGLVLLNAPTRFAEAGRFRDFVLDLDLDQAIDHDGLVPVHVMKPAFKLLDPMGNWHKYAAIEAASHDPTRLRRTLVRERWLEENVPMSGAFAREFIDHCYQRDALLDGTWTLRGETVDLANITAPTLVLACARDFIAPQASVLPAVDVIPNATGQVLETGHIGVVVGGFGPAVFYPLLDAWFREVA